MTVIHGYYAYLIQFEYLTVKRGRRTTCRILRRDPLADQRLDPDVYVVAHAVCGPKDQFVKETGRHLALTRALNQLDIDEFAVDDLKPIRAAFWKAYFGRPRGRSVPL